MAAGPSGDRWSDQRYEPLPGLLGLPRFAWRRIPRAGRIALMVLAAMLLVSAVVATPLIVTGKREGADERRREAAAQRAKEVRRLRADQAPHRSRAAGAPRAPEAARHAAIVSALERAITADARARRRQGSLTGPAAIRTRCRTDDPQLADRQPAARRAGGALLVCLAATTVSVSPGGQPVALGYEFVAAANWRRGTFTWCKTNPPPGEQFGGVQLARVPLSRACLDPGR
jgi:hypothetical protein